MIPSAHPRRTTAVTPVDARRPVPEGARTAIAAAWVVVGMVSALPIILAVELTGSIPSWLWLAQLGVTGGLLVAGLVWGQLRPLRRFAVVMGVLLLLLHALPGVDLRWAPLQSLFGGTVFDQRMQPEQTAKFFVTLTMIGLMLLLGYRRRDFFLAAGRLTAPIRPVRVLGFPHADSWRRFGLVWGFGIAGALAIAQYILVRPSAADFVLVLPLLPSILFYAAVNAFNEEMTYRAPMLASLEPAVGSTHALWQAAVLFGVAHYFGTPGGLLGALLSIFMGWILSKAMVETRGLFWAWFIHFLSDVVIFVFIALALTS